MSFSTAKRASAIIMALVLLSFLFLSPLLDVYGEHDHSCSANRCILCLASNVLSFLRDISFFYLLCAGAALIPIISFLFSSYLKPSISSPVSLKTKITS